MVIFYIVYSILGTNYVALGDKVMERIVDEGEWSVIQDGDRTIIGSTDFLHDVWLYVTGDFADVMQRQAYAELIADRLNKTKPKGIK